MGELCSQRVAPSEGHRRSLANGPQKASSTRACRVEGRLEELVALPSGVHEDCFAEKKKKKRTLTSIALCRSALRVTPIRAASFPDKGEREGRRT
jgi:hypothetical protein